MQFDKNSLVFLHGSFKFGKNKLKAKLNELGVKHCIKWCKDVTHMVGRKFSSSMLHKFSNCTTVIDNPNWNATPQWITRCNQNNATLSNATVVAGENYCYVTYKGKYFNTHFSGQPRHILSYKSTEPMNQMIIEGRTGVGDVVVLSEETLLEHINQIEGADFSELDDAILALICSNDPLNIKTGLTTIQEVKFDKRWAPYLQIQSNLCPDKELQLEIKNFLQRNNILYHRGKLKTMTRRVSEQVSNMKQYMNVQGGEMENLLKIFTNYL